MLIWYFSNNLDKYDYVGKLLEQHFCVSLFSNPWTKLLSLLKFNEARISEWNIDNFNISHGIYLQTIPPSHTIFTHIQCIHFTHVYMHTSHCYCSVTRPVLPYPNIPTMLSTRQPFCAAAS